MVNKSHGFTLIEILIVVVILGILAAISIPSYNQYIIKANRVDAQTTLVDIASKIQRYKVSQGSLSNGSSVIKLTDLGYPALLEIPQNSKPLYKVELSSVTVEGAWELIAEPKISTKQEGDGWLCLNHKGEQFWSKGVDACNFSSNSSWN
ncbi:type IV pilin protein [Acinetobacter lwoffii]|uniref:type IV pilin protein n=1 Tax=Acinetobacter lwoffii TaxID=28090 RepID=UPI002096F52E|nr:type IV pilin protein [Acinetobacter lwoffii]MCO8081402.1 prepilin-type N-terminal cleavage/methylation domain-containing protein [Acinetobacter lwoffii]